MSMGAADVQNKSADQVHDKPHTPHDDHQRGLDFITHADFVDAHMSIFPFQLFEPSWDSGAHGDVVNPTQRFGEDPNHKRPDRDDGDQRPDHLGAAPAIIIFPAGHLPGREEGANTQRVGPNIGKKMHRVRNQREGVRNHPQGELGDHENKTKNERPEEHVLFLVTAFLHRVGDEGGAKIFFYHDIVGLHDVIVFFLAAMPIDEIITFRRHYSKEKKRYTQRIITLYIKY
ncbi:unnamed protein product [Phytomonas sp. Hart1]|nr:unnamed protein product [Phytomonas sp. Hart1]|eukprot:CCW69624.1 unnamed protein product [Phytomonas sp. isolate Hart1]